VLFDIHPQPEHPLVVVVRSGRSTPIGSLDSSEDNQEIRDARKQLASVQRAGLFSTESRLIFTMRKHYESVEEWLDDRRDRGATSIIPPEVMRAARREMRAEGAALAVRYRVRASALRRQDLEDPAVAEAYLAMASASIASLPWDE
jgi:hypothetical protein